MDLECSGDKHHFMKDTKTHSHCRSSEASSVANTRNINTVRVGDLLIGGDACPLVIAGPCAVESKESLLEIAQGVKRAGAQILRGGAFKPRTNPNAFQGLGYEALEYLAFVRKELGMPVVTEVMGIHELESVANACDMIQIGSRNMYNYPLLREVGMTKKPVLLKRGISATIDEWIGAAGYLGHDQVVFCERGIRSYDTHTRNVLDLAAVPVVQKLTGQPVIVDPSHGTGRRDLVTPMALAAIAAGANGIIVEAHSCPEQSVSDAAQAISIEDLTKLITRSRAICKALF